jgi:hypothetical protein
MINIMIICIYKEAMRMHDLSFRENSYNQGSKKFKITNTKIYFAYADHDHALCTTIHMTTHPLPCSVETR